MQPHFAGCMLWLIIEFVLRRKRVTDKMLPVLRPFPVQRAWSNFLQLLLGTSCRRESRSTTGGRAFHVARAKVWNGLPSDVTSASSLSVFKNRLKTNLFRRCYKTIWLWITFLFPSHYLPPQNSGLCNSFFHCLGYSKNVYDDDDEERKSASHTSVVWVFQNAVLQRGIVCFF